MASGPLIEHLHTRADTLPDFLVFSRCVSVRRSGSSDDYRNQISGICYVTDYDEELSTVPPLSRPLKQCVKIHRSSATATLICICTEEE